MRRVQHPAARNKQITLCWPIWFRQGYMGTTPNMAAYGSDAYCAVECGMVNRELERYMSP
jgi:hypothetical protein